MTAIWFIYFTIQMIRSKDTPDDGIAIIPCLVLDGLLAGVFGAFLC